MLDLLTQRPDPRFRHAFRVALAMVIACYLSLSWGWTTPYWAALAINTVSALPELSASLAKARNRILGTLVAASFALLLLGLFFQDRWLFLLSMALWLSFCTYRMTGSAIAYAWLVAGFVAPIIALHSNDDAGTAFLAAVERIQETLLGVCVYMLVLLLLWPEQKPEDEQENDAAPPTAGPAGFFPDPDRLVSSIYVFSTFLLGALLVIYLPAFPNHAYVLALVPSLAMIIASTPYAPLSIIYRPALINILLGAATVVLVLPHLTSFIQLAILIFLASFYTSYRFFEPQMAIARAAGLSIFFLLIHVTNEQHHDFLYTINTAAMVVMGLLILLIFDHFPVSRLPEKRLLWQLRRFEHSARYLAGNRDRPTGPLASYRRAYHRYEVATLPRKLAFWRDHIPAQVMGDYATGLDQLLVDIGAMSERLSRDEDVRESLVALGAGRQELCSSTLAQPRFF